MKHNTRILSPELLSDSTHEQFFSERSALTLWAPFTCTMMDGYDLTYMNSAHLGVKGGEPLGPEETDFLIKATANVKDLSQCSVIIVITNQSIVVQDKSLFHLGK